MYFIRDKQKENNSFVEQNLADICASVQHSIVNILLNKLKKAAKQYNINEIAIAGGVSANSGLRNALLAMKESAGLNVYIPAFEYCADNAAMIAIAAVSYTHLDVYKRQIWLMPESKAVFLVVF